MLKRAGTFGLPEQERAEAMLRNKLLENWMVSPRSKMLLVDGNAGSVEKISPMSFASALLLGTIHDFPQASSTSFFCGQHVDIHEPNTGARLLMSDIVCQLATQFKYFDLSCLDNNNLSTQLGTKRKNLDTLCTIFQSMVLQLGENSTLFCVIDGIKFYEYAGRKKAFLVVLNMFKELVHSENVKATLKILFTSPTTSPPAVRQYFDKDQILRLPSQISRRQIGFNARHWQADTSKKLELSPAQHGHGHEDDELSDEVDSRHDTDSFSDDASVGRTSKFDR